MDRTLTYIYIVAYLVDQGQMTVSCVTVGCQYLPRLASDFEGLAQDLAISAL